MPMPSSMESPTSVICDDSSLGRRTLCKVMSPPHQDDTTLRTDSYFDDSVKKPNVRENPYEMQRYFRNLIQNSTNNTASPQLNSQHQFKKLDCNKGQDCGTVNNENMGVPKCLPVEIKKAGSPVSSNHFCMNTSDDAKQNAPPATTMTDDEKIMMKAQNSNFEINGIPDERLDTPSDKRSSLVSNSSQSLSTKEKQKNDKAVEVLSDNNIIARFRTQTECAKYLRATPEAISYHCSKGGGVCNGLVIRPARDAQGITITGSSSSLDSIKFGLFEGAEENRPKVRPQLAPEAVAILKNWLLSPEHVDNPYPNQRESEMLLKKTGLDKTQLKHWFNNARKRILKPLLKKREFENSCFNEMNKRRKLDVFPSHMSGMMMDNGKSVHDGIGRFSLPENGMTNNFPRHEDNLLPHDSKPLTSFAGSGSPSFFDQCHPSNSAMQDRLRSQRMPYQDHDSIPYQRDSNQMSMMSIGDRDSSSLGGMMNDTYSTRNFEGNNDGSSMVGFDGRSDSNDFNKFDSMVSSNDQSMRGQMDRLPMDSEGRTSSRGMGSNDRYTEFNERSNMGFTNDSGLNSGGISLMGFSDVRNRMVNSGDRFSDFREGSFNSGNDSNAFNMSREFSSTTGMIDSGMRNCQPNDFFRQSSQQEPYQSNNNDIGDLLSGKSNNENMPDLLRSNAVFKQQVAAMAMNEANAAFKEMEDAYMRAKEILNQVQSLSSNWDSNPEDNPKVVEANAVAKKCQGVAMFKLKVSQRANEEAANAYKKFQVASGETDANNDQNYL